MNNLIWLASYPKSGNTWLRSLLDSYHQGGRPVDLNSLVGFNVADRIFLDEMLGVETSNLTHEEVLVLRSAACQRLASEHEGPHFLKTHEALTNPELIRETNTRGVIYLIRNPLDVVVSYAHHNNVSIDVEIERMGDEGRTLNASPGRLYVQLRQQLLSWSGHVRSWVDRPDLKLHLLRYEDLLTDPEGSFAAVLEFIGVAVEPDILEAAISATRFERLQQLEQADGFRENPPGAGAFFRQGQMGGWQEVLDAEQMRRMMAAHGDVMRRFSYQA